MDFLENLENVRILFLNNSIAIKIVYSYIG
jgi:hypothetical protein